MYKIQLVSFKDHNLIDYSKRAWVKPTLIFVNSFFDGQDTFKIV